MMQFAEDVKPYGVKTADIAVPSGTTNHTIKTLWNLPTRNTRNAEFGETADIINPSLGASITAVGGADGIVFFDAVPIRLTRDKWNGYKDQPTERLHPGLKKLCDDLNIKGSISQRYRVATLLSIGREAWILSRECGRRASCPCVRDGAECLQSLSRLALPYISFLITLSWRRGAYLGTKLEVLCNLSRED
jgi:hypothetical protein